MKRIIRQLNSPQPYIPTWQAMQAYSLQRGESDPDEIWLLEHPPVFTQGMAGKAEHVLAPGTIPIVRIDRGGQVTYHGPGQIVCYVLLDLHRNQIGVKRLVSLIEQTLIDVLAEYNVLAERKDKAPGIYVDGAKIASLGLRIKRGNSYHGFALNVDMDLEPFNRINPCGYAGLPITQCRDLGIKEDIETLHTELVKHLAHHLNYHSDTLNWTTEKLEISTNEN